MGELSNALYVPFSRATRIIDALVSDGYVKRMNDPDDRRIVRVALTPEGIKLHHTIENFTTDHVQSITFCSGRRRAAFTVGSDGQNTARPGKSDINFFTLIFLFCNI